MLRTQLGRLGAIICGLLRVVNAHSSIGDFCFKDWSGYHQQMNKESAETLDAHSLKHLEQFSRAVCQQLGKDDSSQFTQSEIIYGLAAFLAAVAAALKEQTPSQ